ncbi:MAG: FAD-binding protein [Solirubrobacteraceae bacterium]
MDSKDAGIVEYEPGDLTVVVAASARIGALAEALAQQDQRLSLDPPGDPTLGECLLEDLSGPLRHRYGTMRDLVLGVTVVLRDGLRANAGGKVVKNVAGYDLGKLFCGSRGRLGSVERLALRLHPRPRAARSAVVARSGWPALQRSQLVPSAVDLVGERLHVLFEGAPAAVDAQLRELGGDEADCWDEIRALQATLPRRRRWEGDGDDAGARAPLVRPGPRVAYTAAAGADQQSDQQWSPLATRVAEALWTRS